MRSRYTTSSGIVLRRRSQPNGDALVTLLSPSGKWTALARAGKTSAGNAGRLNLWADVNVQHYRRREDDLPVITQVTLNGMLPRLSEPELYPLAHYLAELCDALTVNVHFGEPLYEYLTSALRGLCQSPDPEKVTLVYSWGMLRSAGLAPAMGRCGVCFRSVAPAALDFRSGHAVCQDCSPVRGRSQTSLCELAELTSGSVRQAMSLLLEDRAEHWRLLNTYLDHHVMRLRSSQSLRPGKAPLNV